MTHTDTCAAMWVETAARPMARLVLYLGICLSLCMEAHVVVADIGSVSVSSKFAWAAFDHRKGEYPVATGNDPGTCVQAVVQALMSGSPTALLFEAPMAVPVPSAETGWPGLGRARAGEGNRPFSAGAGASVLATGLAQGAWMLGELEHALPEVVVTTQSGTWRGGRARLLLAETFVSGAGKPVSASVDAGHLADATAAGKEFLQRLVRGQLDSDVQCRPERPFNLLAAMAMWANLPIDPAELHLDVLVIRLLPVPVHPARRD